MATNTSGFTVLPDGLKSDAVGGIVALSDSIQCDTVGSTQSVFNGTVNEFMNNNALATNLAAYEEGEIKADDFK